jgi:hypothetical protein
MSTRASHCTFAVWYWKVSQFKGCRTGSTLVFGQTSERSLAVLCLSVGRPPLLQVIAWSTENTVPQQHLLCTPEILQPYRKHSASRNAPLCRKKPCSSWGIVVTLADAPFSDAHSMSQHAFWIIDVSTLLAVACWRSLQDFLISIFSWMRSVFIGLEVSCWMISSTRGAVIFRDDWNSCSASVTELVNLNHPFWLVRLRVCVR